MRIIKKCLKVILCIIGAIALIILIFWLILHYEMNYKKTILYFDGTQEIPYLNDRNKNAASEELDISESEMLDGDRVIQEQSFDVELNDWGEVQFVSYMPDGVPLVGDVSFLLTKENQIIYTFPAYEETGLLESVDAVGFQDIDGDNVKDVIVIMTYVSGAGPTGMVPRKAVRIFRAEGSEFILCHDLMLEILFNIEDEEVSVPAICKYIEENEVY